MSDTNQLLEKLTSGLRTIYGKDLNRIVLYGSVARGTQTEETDIDIAVIIHQDAGEKHDRMIDLTVDLELEYDVVLSVLIIEYKNFKEWEGDVWIWQKSRIF